MIRTFTRITCLCMLIFGLNSQTKAQSWMVGDAVNDTIKYLTLYAWEFDTTIDQTCFELGLPDHNFYMQPCEDPGIDYGFVVEEITNTGNVEITPTEGYVAVGDTVWLVDEDVLREVYFDTMGGHCKLRFFAIGEVTVPDVEVYCSPGNDLWFSDLLFCNEGLWYGPDCTTVSNPLSVENVTMEDAMISYPNATNAYQLSSRSQDVEAIILFDSQGRELTRSQNNSLSCAEFNDGIYLIAVYFKNGQRAGQKFVLTK